MKTIGIVFLFFVITFGFSQEDPSALKSSLLQQLESTYREAGWFAPMTKALEGLSPEQAKWKDSSSNNSIAQSLSHLIFWNRRVLKAFLGETVEDFREDNTVTFNQFNTQDWLLVVKTLDSVQEAWKQAVTQADEQQLLEWHTEILNMCAHNAYHTGQIVYIRKRNGWWESKNAIIPLEKVSSKRFKRLYRINDSVYRSEQPSRNGFRELEALGVKTAITFRRNKDDTKKAKGTAIALVHMPLKTAELTEAQITEALRAINEAEKPVLVHCWHGSDRTGAIMAAYRVVIENWTPEEAIKELRLPDLGYHEKWYPNVVELITTLDKEAIRKALGL